MKIQRQKDKKFIVRIENFTGGKKMLIVSRSIRHIKSLFPPKDKVAY